MADPAFGRLKRILIERTGLSYYEDRDLELATAVAARMHALRLPRCAAYRLLLEAEPDHPEFYAIAARLTIGETYFFRHAEQFAALREVVLPRILHENRQRRTIRIWCAGCATGAEPYSISILLRRDLAPLTAGWDIQIVGSDINEDCLQTAEGGVFRNWAMRSLPDDIREECFRPADQKWKIEPKYHEGVFFRRHNLASDFAPAIDSPDLILCRNVMIYFSPERVSELIDRFHSWLVPCGWLVVGHAEVQIGRFHRFSLLTTADVSLYQKHPDSNAAGCQTVPEYRPPGMAGKVLRIAAPPPVSQSWSVVEERIAKRDWSGAEDSCDRMLALDQVNSRGHFLKAVILRAAGKTEEEEKSLRRAIYLNRGFAAAHFRLASLLESRDDMRSALRAWETTARLLSSLPPENEPIPFSNLDAEALLHTVRGKLEACKTQ